MKTDSRNEATGALRTAKNEPNVREMHAELQASIDGAVDRIANMQTDADTRHCRWTGQQENGRKPNLVNGKPAEPWPGASDVRIRLADEFINDDVVLMKTAGRRAGLTIKGTEAGDMQRASKVQIYLDHLRYTRIRKQVAHESELAAQWRQTYGYALLAVTWQREHERSYDTVTLAQLTEAAAAGPESPAATILAALYVADSDTKATLARLLMQMYEDLDRAEAYRQLQALRTQGEMTLPVRRLRVNVAQWKALRPWRDVFFPVNTEDVQTARWVAWRRTFNRAQIEEKALSEGWSDEWIDAVLETEGKTVLDFSQRQEALGDRRVNWRDEAEEMEGLYEVFYFYYTATDGETGVPCKHVTVMSPHVAPDGQAAPHGPDSPLGDEHGKFPFVELRRDRLDPALADARGVPSLVATQQREIKHARDARIDQTDMVLQPPVIRPEREIGLPLTFRPRGEIGERRANQTRFMPVASTAPAAQPLEADALKDARRYFARNRADDPQRTATYEQALVDDWCEELGEAWGMTLQLAQQYESELTFSRTVGGKPVAFRVSRDEIQGQYDLQLFYNTENADPEKRQAKTERLQKVYVPLDRAGILNLAPVVGGLFALDFPEFADQAVQGVEQAGIKEVEDEQKNWALMIAGEQPVMQPDGQNFALRLQWLQGKIAQPGAQARLAMLPDSAELVQKRLEHFTFMLQQQQNAVTGTVGVEAAGPGGV